jgi:hypothetical protein
MSTAVLPIERVEMRTAVLRRSAARPTVEALLARIDSLARERQELRGSRASSPTLERNRRALVRSQWELSYALIEQHRRLGPVRDAA